MLLVLWYCRVMQHLRVQVLRLSLQFLQLPGLCCYLGHPGMQC
jgi:hypothetical protein